MIYGQTIREKLMRDPVGVVKRGLYKTTLGRIKYGRRDGYDAQGYWHDRLTRAGSSLKGVGDEGLSEADNEKMYALTGSIYMDALERGRVDLGTTRVLEIGCGTGYYTQLMLDAGVTTLTGVDITDTYFSGLRESFPNFTFQRGDISTARLDGPFDAIAMIDVIQHIVTDETMDAAMDNVKANLAPGGLFIVAPIMKRARTVTFCNRAWTREEFIARFQGAEFTIDEPVRFKDSELLTIRKA